MTSSPACGECGAPMVRRTSRFGIFYGCSRYPECKGAHGAHQATGEPFGIPADGPTKSARIKAHAAFDRLWKDGAMTRKNAYRWMRDALGLTKEEAHISRFDIATCDRLVLAVKEKVLKV